jgi:short chain dehydrogenase
VTGATSGIGRAVALQLARDGAEVVVHGRNAERGAKTVREITAAGGQASFVAADLTDAADVQWLASEVGDIDILINNAGIWLSARRQSSILPDSTRCSPATFLPYLDARVVLAPPDADITSHHASRPRACPADPTVGRGEQTSRRGYTASRCSAQPRAPRQTPRQQCARSRPARL